MDYKFYIDDNTGTLTAIFYDPEYKEFGGWFWYETAATEIQDIVLKYIEDSRDDECIFLGSEYVNYISKDGLSIRPIEAFELDLISLDYPESKKIPLKTIKKIILKWKKMQLEKEG